MNRRDFLIKTFKLGGAVACASIGFTPKEIAWADAGLIEEDAISGVETGGGGDTYMFRYNADHVSGNLYAYTDSGSGSAQGTLSGATVSTAQNHTSGGSNSLLVNSGGEDIRWTSGVSGYVNTSEGSIEIWAYIDIATITSGTSLFEIYPSAAASANMLRSQIGDNGTVYFRHEGGNTVVSMTTTGTVSTQTWQRIRFRWSVASNIIGVQIGTGSWEDDADGDSVTAFASAEDTLLIGDGAYNTVSNSHDGYLDDFESISGYNTFND